MDWPGRHLRVFAGPRHTLRHTPLRRQLPTLLSTGEGEGRAGNTRETREIVVISRPRERTCYADGLDVAEVKSVTRLRSDVG